MSDIIVISVAMLWYVCLSVRLSHS